MQASHSTLPTNLSTSCALPSTRSPKLIKYALLCLVCVDLWQWFAYGLGAVSLALLGTRTWRSFKSAMRYRQIRKQLEQDERVRNRESARPASTPSSSPRTDDGGQQTCIVCWDRPANAAFIPCGHNCVCRRCGMELTRCPICRRQCVVYRIYPL